MKPEFDPERWTAESARCVELELLMWQRRMAFDTIRALAIDCHPWHEGAFTLSMLTDRELHDESETGKWSVADWRMYHFTSGPNTQWPLAETLMQSAHTYYMKGEEEDRAEEVRDELIGCCVRALSSDGVARALMRYKLSADFELFAGHPDAPGKNHVGRDDLSVVAVLGVP